MFAVGCTVVLGPFDSACKTAQCLARSIRGHRNMPPAQPRPPGRAAQTSLPQRLRRGAFDTPLIYADVNGKSPIGPSLARPAPPSSSLPAVVWSTNLFYKGSAAWDVVNSAYPNQGLADDNAIATDKTYYAGGVPATFANVSNYSAGINGLMVDIGSSFAGGGPHGTLTASDFIFKVGNNNSSALGRRPLRPFGDDANWHGRARFGPRGDHLGKQCDSERMA